MSRPHEMVVCQYDNDRGGCSCGLVDQVSVVAAHVRILEGLSDAVDVRPVEEHIYPQGTPASAVDYPWGVATGGNVLAIRLQKVAQAYPYALAVIQACQSCLTLLSKDLVLEGAGLDLAVMAHAMHRLAERGIDPYENPQEVAA